MADTGFSRLPAELLGEVISDVPEFILEAESNMQHVCHCRAAFCLCVQATFSEGIGLILSTRYECGKEWPGLSMSLLILQRSQRMSILIVRLQPYNYYPLNN